MVSGGAEAHIKLTLIKKKKNLWEERMCSFEEMEIDNEYVALEDEPRC